MLSSRLHPNTYDRGLKFEYYRNIETLKEYVLIEPDRRHTDLFRRRDEDEFWVLYASGTTDDVVLESVGIWLSYFPLLVCGNFEKYFYKTYNYKRTRQLHHSSFWVG